MKECECRKVIIDDTNAIEVELVNGYKYDIYDGDDNFDMNDPYFEKCDDNDNAEKEGKDEKINKRQQQK